MGIGVAIIHRIPSIQHDLSFLTNKCRDTELFLIGSLHNNKVYTPAAAMSLSVSFDEAFISPLPKVWQVRKRLFAGLNEDICYLSRTCL